MFIEPRTTDTSPSILTVVEKLDAPWHDPPPQPAAETPVMPLERAKAVLEHKLDAIVTHSAARVARTYFMDRG